MPFYKADLLNHFKALQPALLALGAEAFLDPCTFTLRIRLGATARVFHPQFLAVTKGVRQYTPAFNAAVRRFTGWCPYVNRRWPLASEKLAFKRFAVENALRTPEYSADPRAQMSDVVVKRSVSSFGAAIQGPFRQSSEHSLNPEQGEYFERFIPGTIAKIWYWNDQPVCMELEKMPEVKGNGVSSLRKLAAKRLPKAARQRAVEALAPFLEYQGTSLDAVPAKAELRTIEFRYGSRFSGRVKNVDLASDAAPALLLSQLREIGSKLWLGIPDHLRSGIVYTVDAIVDAKEMVWALEMNSNPFIHPYVYPAMVGSLFAAAKEKPKEAALPA